MKRKSLMSVLLASILIAVPVVLMAQHQHGTAAPAAAGSETSVFGEVVCLTCYTQKGLHGPEHADCARECYGKGLGIGLLTAEGEVYALKPNSTETKFTKTADFAANHALMCVEMPLGFAADLMGYEMKDFPVITFKKRVAMPGPEVVGRQVNAVGTQAEENGAKVFYFLSLAVTEGSQQAAAEVYACPMHPEVVSDQPGQCPECGMNLEKKKPEKAKE